MKSIRRKDFTEVGSVAKVHGTRGELKCICTREFRLKEWAFLEFQGKPVPFYIESEREVLDDERILKLKSIDSPEQAAQFLGRTLLVPRKQVIQNADDNLPDAIIGFEVTDEEHGHLGHIEKVHDQQVQVLIEVKQEGRNNILIPWVEAFIVDVDEDNEVIITSIPADLLNLNNS